MGLTAARANGIKEVFRQRNKDKAEAILYFMENAVGEMEVCKMFGCGKKLLSQEILCGGYCVRHQERETSLDIIDKYYSQ